MMNMKKLTCLGLSLALALGLFTGCGSSNQDQGSGSGSQSNTNDSSTVELSGTVNTAGSTSMKDVMAVLTEVFEKENPGVNINYTGSGSGAGIEGATSGTCDIGLSSRALKDKEKESGAVENIVALDGVAIVINPANGVENLTVEQIAQIFTGEITNWSEVGGTDGEIAVFGREAGSGTRGAFEEIVGVVDTCKYTNEYSSTGDVIGNVASNPNAIGYASLSAVGDTVAMVTVEGVECSEDTVKDGSYKIQRPFVFVTNKSAALSEQAQAFVDFATSKDAADLIRTAGAVPVNE